MSFDRKTFNVCLTDYRQCPQAFHSLFPSRSFEFIESRALLLCEPHIVRTVSCSSSMFTLHSMIDECVTLARDKKWQQHQAQMNY